MSKKKIDQPEDEVIKRPELGKPCLPLEMKPQPTCDIMSLSYRLRVAAPKSKRFVLLGLHYEVERCSLEYTLGDLAYSTTLLPQERVWLSFRNRHSVSRLTEDVLYSASTHARSSESLWMDTYRNLSSDIEKTDKTRTTSSSQSSFETKGEGGYWSFLFWGGGDVEVSGKFDSQSAMDFSREVQEHLRSSFHQTNEIVRTAESTSITEINSHRAVEQEVKDELKAGVRVFQNINHCHTLTFLFYQIARRQRLRISLAGVSYRAVNPDAQTSIFRKGYQLNVADSQEVLKVSERIKYPDLAAMLKASSNPSAPRVARYVVAAKQPAVLLTDMEFVKAAPTVDMQIPMTDRERAVDEVKKLLPETSFKFEFVQETLLPTNAVYVDAKLGECLACEPYVLEKQKLELERLDLENQRLRRETELLDKHQLYRCCPPGEKE